MSTETTDRTPTLPDCPMCGEKADPRFYYRDTMFCDGCWPKEGTWWHARVGRHFDALAERDRLREEVAMLRERECGMIESYNAARKTNEADLAALRSALTSAGVTGDAEGVAKLAHRMREAEAAWGHLESQLDEEMRRDVLPSHHSFIDNPHHPGTCRRHVTYPNEPTACCGYPPEAHAKSYTVERAEP